MSKYKGLFTFDVDNHRYIPVGQADGIIDCFDFSGEAKEPLIKNEKVRKAVRAWADTYEIVAVRHIVLSYDKTKHSVFERGYGNDYSAITLETELDFVDGDTYSIAELCGEDEE